MKMKVSVSWKHMFMFNKLILLAWPIAELAGAERCLKVVTTQVEGSRCVCLS